MKISYVPKSDLVETTKITALRVPIAFSFRSDEPIRDTAHTVTLHAKNDICISAEGSVVKVLLHCVKELISKGGNVPVITRSVLRDPNSNGSIGIAVFEFSFKAGMDLYPTSYFDAISYGPSDYSYIDLDRLSDFKNYRCKLVELILDEEWQGNNDSINEQETFEIIYNDGDYLISHRVDYKDFLRKN